MDITPLLKNTSRSLYLSVQALPPSIRGAFGIAYLLCRYADTIADTYLVPHSRRLYWVKEFPGIVRRQDRTAGETLAREIAGVTDNPHEALLLQNLNACLDAFNSLSEQHQQFTHDVVRAVCEGMETDLISFPAETADGVKAWPDAAQLEKYCRLMGGMPGEFWSKLIYSSCRVKIPEEQFYALSRNVGDALQIVNILRDLPKDLRIGRCYFPQEDLAQAGLTAPQLLDSACSEKFEPVKRKWISWGRQKLHAAQTYYAALPQTQFCNRAAVAWPVLWAADTLNKLETETNLLDATHRVKIPRSRIYGTLALTPLLLMGNAVFNRWLNSKLRPEPAESRHA